MGVNGILARSAATRVHVLLVEIPGYAVLRMRVEAAIASRGWVQADAPADADVLLVCGDPTDRFVEPLEAVWCQLSSPRHRCRVPDAAAVVSVLDAIPAALQSRSRVVQVEGPRGEHLDALIASTIGPAAELIAQEQPTTWRRLHAQLTELLDRARSARAVTTHLRALASAMPRRTMH